MNIGTLFGEKPCVFALEVFPPKRDAAVESVYKTLDRLGELPFDYVSVTYSAGGSGNRAYTGELARYLKHNLGIEPLAHLTCLNSSKEEVEEELQGLAAAGIKNILALRGDKNPAAPPRSDYRYASDLIADISEDGRFYTAGACYAEGHPESPNPDADIDALKHKIEAGAGHLISQLFFDNARYYRFLSRLRKKGISCPVEAGVMPIVRPEQVSRTLSLSSASLPADFSKLLSRYEGDPEGFYDAGIDYASRQIRDLIEGGADGIHLYAMNRPRVARRIYENIADLL